MDHTNFGPQGPRPELTGKEDRRWWLLTGDEAANSVSSVLADLRQQQLARLSQFTVCSRLYGNTSVFALAGAPAARYVQNYAIMRDRVSYNIVQSAVDTVTAKVAKNRPRPLFLTTGGDYTQQRKAKKLNRWVEGVFYENDAYNLGVSAFRDGAVCGDGVMHVYADSGRVKFERVLPVEIWVDEQEGSYNKPRQMHRTKLVDRSVLIETVREWLSDAPKKEREEKIGWVAAADEFKPQPDMGRDVSDLVEVRESWHLPNGPDPTKDEPLNGKRIISVAGHALLEEPWLRDHFPFARFSWCPRLVGFWAQGGAEQCQQIQFEVNKLLGVIQRSFELGGSFTWLIEKGSKVPAAHLNNQIGKVVEYIGTKPEAVTPVLVSGEIFQHLLTLKNAAFEQFGISQLSAASLKPAGLNSGVALREYNDIESDRFQTIGHAYEDFFLDLAKLSIEAAKEATAGRRSMVVKVPGRRFIEQIDWRDVNLPEDSWVMKCYPVSSLPRDPAGRLQTIQEWAQAGLIAPRQVKRLMDFPDLDMADDLSSAAEDYLTEILDRMLDEGVYTQPEPFDNLALAMEMCTEYYSYARIQHVERDRLELLRRFMGQIQDLKMEMASQAAAANGQMAGAAPGGPPGGPGQGMTPQAPPQAPQPSDLVPNAPGMQAAA